MSKFGKIVKVTVVKERSTRRSKGVAFVLFLEKVDAEACVAQTHGTQLKDRTISCSIAKDNGRTTEFIRRKEYPDKSRCFECGDGGHLSYSCPKNNMGPRQPPPKKKKKAPKGLPRPQSSGSGHWSGKSVGGSRVQTLSHPDGDGQEDDEEEEEQEGEEGEDPQLESLSAAIRYEQEKVEEERLFRDLPSEGGTHSVAKKRKIRKSGYFSDEEEEESD
jgi:U11/U12 small nuclear ribonucleoprotein SNRNP31